MLPLFSYEYNSSTQRISVDQFVIRLFMNLSGENLVPKPKDEMEEAGQHKQC
jgi:hypothetical protein